MEFEFSNEIWEWRGPAPFYFVSVPEDQAEEIREAAKVLTYGWGMIPVVATIGHIEFKTSMFAKNGTYVLPLKNVVRLPLKLEAGDTVSVSMVLGA
ncbi:MAG: hypothetical protein RL036_826 [Actinomycetota bacterium]|jgi:hypothetical protein